MGVGGLVLLGAFGGLIVGAFLGTFVAHTGGGDIQSLNDLAGLFVAGICVIGGALVGLGVGLARRESVSRPVEAPEDHREPPYWPPPPNWSPPIEQKSETDPQP
jgi:hypothetical protein